MSKSDAKASKQHIPKHSIMISIDSLDNELRVASTNKDAIYQIIEWYEQLTNEKAIKDKTAKYTNVFILNSALNRNIFGNDWIGIIVDFMFSLGYELIGNGNFVFDSKNSKQLKTIMFISTNITQKLLKSNYTPKIKYESIKKIHHNKDIQEYKDEKPQKNLSKNSKKNKIQSNIQSKDEKYKLEKPQKNLSKNSKKNKVEIESKNEKYKLDKPQKNLSKNSKKNKIESKDEKYKSQTETLNDIKSENKNDNNIQSPNNEILIQSESSPAVYSHSEILIIDEKNKNKISLNKYDKKEEKEEIILDEIKNEKIISNIDKNDIIKTKKLDPEIEIEEPKNMKIHKKKKKKKKNFRDDPKNQFRRKKSRNKHGRNRAKSEGHVRIRVEYEEEEEKSETESILMMKKMNSEEMNALILYCLERKQLVSDQSDVRLITNLVKVTLKLNGGKFVKMSRNEFEHKFKWLKPTQAGRLYNELREQLSKQEMVRVLKNSMVRSKSSSKRDKKKKNVKGKRQKTRIQLTVDSGDGSGNEDSDGF